MSNEPGDEKEPGNVNTKPPRWSKHLDQFYDLCCRAMATGNFGSLMLLFAIAFLSIWIGKEATQNLLKEFIHSAVWCSLGWILLFISIFACFKLLRWQKNIHDGELERVAEEKKRLQARSFTGDLFTTKDLRK